MHRTPSEVQRGKECHERMVLMLKREFPKMSVVWRKGIQNRVSKILRKCGQDIIQVWISSKPLNEAQYVSNYDFVHGKTRVYVQVQVD
jgi:hypothetical protein